MRPTRTAPSSTDTLVMTLALPPLPRAVLAATLGHAAQYAQAAATVQPLDPSAPDGLRHSFPDDLRLSFLALGSVLARAAGETHDLVPPPSFDELAALPADDLVRLTRQLVARAAEGRPVPPWLPVALAPLSTAAELLAARLADLTAPVTTGLLASLAEIHRAAQGCLRVGRLGPIGEVRTGHAQTIVADTHGRDAGDRDVRECLLNVVDDVDGTNLHWPVSELLAEHAQGTFVVDYQGQARPGVTAEQADH